MPDLNRKGFLQSLAVGGGSLLAGSTRALAQLSTSSAASASPHSPSVSLKSDEFELALTLFPSLTARLVHLPSKTVWAEGPYSYSFGNPAFAVTSSDASSVTLTGAVAGGLVVEHSFRVPAHSPWIEEEIIVRNPVPQDQRPAVVFENWDKSTYEGWTVEGTAFGAGPMDRAILERQMGPLGGESPRLVNSFFTSNGDAGVGKLTSAPFIIARHYIDIWIGGGDIVGKTCVNLVIDGKVVQSQTGARDKLARHFFDVRDFKGKQAQLEIVDASSDAWGHIGVGSIVFSDVAGDRSPRVARSPFRCGFVLPVKDDTLAGYTFTAVPFRREPHNDRLIVADYSLEQILTQTRRSSLREWTSTEQDHPQRLYEDYVSEGWAITNGTTGFLITKYNQTAREFAILDTIPGPDLRWGGAGTCLSDCEGAIHIPVGQEHSFGVSRLTAFAGDLTQGYYAFRSEMESRGMGLPAGFNPPVHWNELYDNKLWWNGQDVPENRQKYYRLDDMKAEATKAKAIGCEALYCDPGWDTNFGSKIWDESRLGKLTDFVAMLKNDYGLRLSLHTPLSGWSNPTSFPPECFRRDENGQQGSLCGASKQYIDETVRRLNVLAEGGVVYFMFDGTSYNGDPCWDASHGHPLPLTCSAHVDATNLIARRVHEKYPQVSIEMHDQIIGGEPFRNVPLYYGYGADDRNVRGFDTIWAFEMMWDPMGNLRSGQSLVLYYYNLAYSLPLYLHIDLRTDNDQALVFWWNASTCRYLGIGGTHADPKVNDAHFAAMKTYKRLKPFYTAGIFYGINEMVHLHRHPMDNAAVINCFSVGAPTTTSLPFDPARFGLKTGKEYKFTGATFTKTSEGLVIHVSVNSDGHTLVEITEA